MFIGIRQVSKWMPDGGSQIPYCWSRCESWTIKKAEHWRIDGFECGAGEDPWESLDNKETKPVNPKGNQPWRFIGRTGTEAEAPILWPPDVKSWLIGKDLEGGEDWGQEEKEAIEDELVGWHHWLNGHKSEQTPGDSEGQRSPVCCSL